MATWIYEGIQCYVALDSLTEFYRYDFGAIKPMSSPPVLSTFEREINLPAIQPSIRSSNSGGAEIEQSKKHVPLYRSWNGKDHFYTTVKTEYDRLPKKYAREGIQGYILSEADNDHVPLYRMYKGSIDDHFYTTSETEKNITVSSYGYTYEGIAGYVRTTKVPNHVPLYRAWNPGICDHFYTTSMQEIDAVAPKVSKSQFESLIKNKLEDCLKNENLYFADKSYLCPKKEIAQEIIDKSLVDQRRYIAEKDDCDDFAHLLKSAFIENSYNYGLKSLPFAFGIVWGSEPAHAMNIIITNDDGITNELYIVDPQTGTMHNPGDRKLGDIYLVIA
jgi:hypothetical protein